MADEPRSSREEIPYRVDDVVSVASVRARFPDLAPDARTGERVRLAGRLMRLRRQGRLIFADLVDSSGRLQLLVTVDRTADFEGFAKHRVLGDWVSVVGEVVTSRKGELSVAVEDWQLLARARRGFGE
jgi:lysyl-tRNA synthetase class 2